MSRRIAVSAPGLGLLLVSVGVAACGAAPGPSPAQPGATGSDAPSTGTCAITQQPGPGDSPPDGSGDLMDFTDFGGGRYHLCIGQPVPIEYEHSAWCRWNEARDTVVEVQGVPQQASGLQIDAGVSLQRAELYLSTTDLGGAGTGLIGSYQTRPGELRAQVTEDGTSGGASFEAPLIVDPEAGTPPGSAPVVRGAFVWLCGDAPPPA